MDKISFLKGLALGLAGKPLEFASRKEPTAFFYGHVAKDGETPTHTFDGVDYVGVVLPPLPKWDKTVYPYALIYRYEVATDLFIFHASTEKIQYDTNNNSPRLIYTLEHGYASCECYSGDKEWGEISEGNRKAGVWIKAEQAVWVNFDIYKEDGTLYLSASDPIPIYE